jgi:hypothetical protein
MDRPTGTSSPPLLNYSDQELYQILGLNHPTDRELEAKIHQLLDMYQETDANMYTFIDQIYRHFFDIEEEEEEDDKTKTSYPQQEGFESRESRPTTTTTTTNTNNLPEIIDYVDASSSNINPNTIQYQKSLVYTPGKVNPILKETIQRVISIDSQHRDRNINKNVNDYCATDFTFNLSEPLQDVVFMKLYSVQIPVTWYTVDSLYGSNFFYLKGNKPGIDNVNFDLQIKIPEGNYKDPTAVVNKVHESIQTMIANHPDINFGQTDLLYDTNNGRGTMRVDLQNIYNENHYYLEFPPVTLPTIPQYIDYTTDTAPFVYMSYFNIRLSTYILPDFIDIYKRYHTLDELNTDLSNNIDAKIRKIPLRTITSQIYDSSPEITDKLFNLSIHDQSYNQLIGQMANFSIEQLLFLTNMTDPQLTTFFDLDPSQQLHLSTAPILSTNMSTFAQQDPSLVYLEYNLFHEDIQPTQYTDISNLAPPHFTTISQLYPIYIREGILKLSTAYSLTQLNVLEQHSNNELVAISTVSDSSLSILRDASYGPLHTILVDLSDQRITLNELTTTQSLPTYTLSVLSDISSTTWQNITDISNLMYYYPDISNITPSQYQYLSTTYHNDEADVQLTLLSQLTFTVVQYNALISIVPHINQELYDTQYLSLFYDLDPSDISTLYQYTGSATGATSKQSNFFSKLTGLATDTGCDIVQFMIDVQDLSTDQLTKLKQLSTSTTATNYDIYTGIVLKINELLANNMIQMYGLQYVHSPQIQVLSELDPIHLQILSELTPIHLQILSELTPIQLQILSEMTPLQLQILSELDPLPIQVLSQLSAQNMKWVLELSAVQLTELSPNYLQTNVINFILIDTPSKRHNFLSKYIPLAKIGMNEIQWTTIQSVYNTILSTVYPFLFDMFTSTSTSTITSFPGQYEYIRLLLLNQSTSASTNYYYVSRIQDAWTNLTHLYTWLPDAYLLSLTPTQHHELVDYYLQGNSFYNNYIPPLLPDHIPEFITNVTTYVVKTIAQDMSQWTSDQLNEWNVITHLDYTPTQLEQLSELTQPEIATLVGIIDIGRTTLNQMYTILTTNSSPQYHLIKLVRFSQYYSLFLDVSNHQLDTNPLIQSFPAKDVSFTIPPPLSNVFNDLTTTTTPEYYGYQWDEWTQLIYQQITTSGHGEFKDSTLYLDPSNPTHLHMNITVKKKLPGYYLMSFYDPVNYPKNKSQSDTLVWDSSGEHQNLWYKYLHIPYASEILISDTSFNVLLPDTSNNVLLLKREKTWDICANFTITPTYVEVKRNTIYDVYTLTSLFSYDNDVYDFSTYSSHVFYGSEYNYKNDNFLYNDLGIQLDPSFATTPSFQVEMYPTVVHEMPYPNQPVSHSNYTYMDMDACANHHQQWNFSLNTLDPTQLSYAYQDIIEAVNQSLQDSNVFTSDSRLWIRDESTHIDVSSIRLPLHVNGTYTFQFTLKLARKQAYKSIKNIPNLKLVLHLMDTTLWTDVFRFPRMDNEFSRVISESATLSHNLYFDPTLPPPYIQFTCITPGFQGRGNDLQVPLIRPDNTTNYEDQGYSYLQYVDALNRSLTTVPARQWGLSGNVTNPTPQFRLQMQVDVQHRIGKNDPTTGEANFCIDLTQTIFATFITDPSAWTLYTTTNTQQQQTIVIGPLNIPGVFLVTDDNSRIHVTCQGPNQDSSAMLHIPTVNAYNRYNASQNNVYTMTDLVNTMNEFVFVASPTQHVSMYGSRMTYNVNDKTITLTLNIQSILTNADYQMEFMDPSGTTTTYKPWDTNSWHTYAYIEDASYRLVDLSGINHNILYGQSAMVDKTVLLNEQNNFFTLKPAYHAEGGVYISTNTNDIVIYLDQLPINVFYTINDIMNEINYQLTHYKNAYGNVTHGSYVYLDASNHVVFHFNVNTTYTTQDYVLDFFDTESFTNCYYGSNASKQSAKWDTTLGWLLGFHSQTMYFLTPENISLNPNIDQTTYYGDYVFNQYTYDVSTNIAYLRGDTPISVNLYNYFLLVLDDYTQSHMNDGLITITKSAYDVPLNSYAIRHTGLKCLALDNATNATSSNNNNNNRQLYVQNIQDPVTKNSSTSRQLYSMNQKLNARNHTSQLQNPYQTTFGPHSQDIFGIIPAPKPGLNIGQMYIEFGGTLQNQDRAYFGPVNIRRMTVRLLTDKGNVLNLNNSDWSFSLIVQQLYNNNTTTTSTKKT